MAPVKKYWKHSLYQEDENPHQVPRRGLEPLPAGRQVQILCRREELNLYALFRHRILNPACIPISPLRHLSIYFFNNFSSIT